MPLAISLMLVPMTFSTRSSGWSPPAGLGDGGQQSHLNAQYCAVKIVGCQYGGTVLCIEISMTRTYTLKMRAEQQAETRRRIVEAAVDLHGSVGPALTSLSMVAERAGVQRHTLYAHFPDERSLYMACSGLSLERDPLPNAADWRRI